MRCGGSIDGLLRKVLHRVEQFAPALSEQRRVGTVEGDL
jgi:hypothetical protein